MVEYFEPSAVSAHFVNPGKEGHECPGCSMEKEREKEVVLEPRQIEVLMKLAAEVPGTLNVETRQVLGELRMLGLVDRIYCAGYTDHRGWQLLDAGVAMVSSWAVHIPRLKEMDDVLAGGIPRDKIAQVWGRAEVPEPEEK
jgi:hypothetical protein